MSKRNRRKTESNRAKEPVNWIAILYASNVMVLWVGCLVWFQRNEARYLLVEDAMPFLMMVAALSFSFAWKTVSDEIGKAFPEGRWALFYWLGLASPMLALVIWVAAALMEHHLVL